jgi:hypothetical protein
MTVGHQNLCEYAEDEWSLYRLWDDDLKKNMRRRQRCEVMGFLLLFGAPAIWQMGIPNWRSYARLLESCLCTEQSST